MTTRSELKDRLVRRGAQPVNVSFPDGWVRLLAELDADLSDLAPSYTVSQVKVKFDSLRFYYGAPGVDSATVEQMSALVKAAENAASRTCETCGKPGVGREGYFILCDEHSNGREPWGDDD